MAEAHIEEESLEREAPLSLTEQLRKISPEFPPVELNFYFGSHWSEADADVFRHILDASDVFFPEFAGYGPEDEKVFEEVSEGIIDPDEGADRARIHGKFAMGLLKNLYETKKVVGFIDLPHGSKLIEDTINLVNDSDNTFPGMSLDEAMSEQRKYFDVYAKLQLEREEYMIDRLPKALIELSEKYPDLLKKSKIQCLVFLGTSHKSLYHKGYASDKQALAFHEPKGLYPGFASKIVMQLKKGKQPGESLFLHALIEDILAGNVIDEMESVALSGVELMKLCRTTINMFSDSELEELFDTREQGVLKTMQAKLEERGVKFPETREEVLDFIK